MEYNYTLLENEAIRYYEMVARSSKDVRIAQLMTLIWGPALAILILIIFRAYHDSVYVILAVAFSLIWIVGIFPILFRYVIYVSAKRKIKSNISLFSKIDVKLAENMVVNDVKKDVADFYIYFDLLIISFNDDTNLIVPERIFNGDEEKMQMFLTKIIELKEV